MKNFTKLCCAIIAVLIVGCGNDDDESSPVPQREKGYR